MYRLDTNVISELRRSKPHGAVLAWLQGVDDKDLYISAVTIGEIQAGIKLSREPGGAKAEQIERWRDQVGDTFNVPAMDAAHIQNLGQVDAQDFQYLVRRRHDLRHRQNSSANRSHPQYISPTSVRRCILLIAKGGIRFQFLKLNPNDELPTSIVRQ